MKVFDKKTVEGYIENRKRTSIFLNFIWFKLTFPAKVHNVIMMFQI